MCEYSQNLVTYGVCGHEYKAKKKKENDCERETCKDSSEHFTNAHNCETTCQQAEIIKPFYPKYPTAECQKCAEKAAKKAAKKVATQEPSPSLLSRVLYSVLYSVRSLFPGDRRGGRVDLTE